jgi:hypothetical protein
MHAAITSGRLRQSLFTLPIAIGTNSILHSLTWALPSAQAIRCKSSLRSGLSTTILNANKN